MSDEILPRVVDYYVDGRGRRPFREWLEGLRDVKAQIQVRLRLDRLMLGHFGDCRSVGGGVFELKIDLGPGYRVYFGLEKKQVVLLLCGGDKGSQERDIRRAQEYWMDQRRRFHGKKT